MLVLKLARSITLIKTVNKLQSRHCIKMNFQKTNNINDIESLLI